MKKEEIDILFGHRIVKNSIGKEAIKATCVVIYKMKQISFGSVVKKNNDLADRVEAEKQALLKAASKLPKAQRKVIIPLFFERLEEIKRFILEDRSKMLRKNLKYKLAPYKVKDTSSLKKKNNSIKIKELISFDSFAEFIKWIKEVDKSTELAINKKEIN